MSRAAALLLLAAAASCGSDQESFPLAKAPPSRHSALRAALIEDARGFAFADGDWLEDLGDAPFFGVATLTRRSDLAPEEASRRDAALARAEALFAEDLVRGDLQEKVMAALGVLQHVGATGDRRLLPALDAFLDRLDSLVRTFGDDLSGAADASWAVRVYGPTTVTALVALCSAEHALVTGAGPRLARAKELDATLRARAVRDLVTPTGRTVRAYASGPDRSDLDLYPNVAMLLLKARLYRLTRDETYRLEARALYAALQPLKTSSQPVRYASPYAAEGLGVTPLAAATLSSQGYLALALLLLFEVTGDRRFVDEADGVLDAVEAMRGPWCRSQVHDQAACTPACPTGEACTGQTCGADRCTTGLLHHVVSGRLAEPGEGTLFCAGCTFETLFVLGTRRTLAGEPF